MAIASGISNDLGSGSCVDICVLRSTGRVDYMRGYQKEEVSVADKGPLRLFARNSAASSQLSMSAPSGASGAGGAGAAGAAAVGGWDLEVERNGDAADDIGLL